MTDPPIDITQAREQDAPGTHDAKRRAPVHGHTGDVPHDKALSDNLRSEQATCKIAEGSAGVGVGDELLCCCYCAGRAGSRSAWPAPHPHASPWYYVVCPGPRGEMLRCGCGSPQYTAMAAVLYFSFSAAIYIANACGAAARLSAVHTTLPHR
eukprot:scaffold9414_cov156-Isochrysis_galbana.AAC.4